MFLFHIAPIAFAAVFLSGAEGQGFCTYPAKKGTDLQVPAMIKQTELVKDYGNQRLVASNVPDCSINGAANAYHIISVPDGGTVKNLILGNPGKGIWCEGSCTLENVFFERVCYHAVGFAASNTAKTFRVVGGAAQNAPDKIFTQAGRGQTIISGFCGDKFTTAIASCGGKECGSVQRTITIQNSKFRGPALQLVSLNPKFGDKVSFSGVELYGQNSGKKISYACREWDIDAGKTIPETASLTTEDGKGPSCSYSASGIRIVN